MSTDDRRLHALDDDQRRERNPAREAHDALETALFEIKRVIVGQEAMLERVIVALGDIELTASGTRKKLVRGDVAVFPADEEYEPPTSGSFFEVAIRSAHPPVQSPPEIIAPEKNAMRYDGAGFFVFEEKLAPGETRARHSHSQRVVMQLNRTKLLISQ